MGRYIRIWWPISLILASIAGVILWAAFLTGSEDITVLGEALYQLAMIILGGFGSYLSCVKVNEGQFRSVVRERYKRREKSWRACVRMLECIGDALEVIERVKDSHPAVLGEGGAHIAGESGTAFQVLATDLVNLKEEEELCLDSLNRLAPEELGEMHSTFIENIRGRM